MQSITALIIFFYLPGLFVFVRNIFHSTYIWQIKEYRLDRIISHLKFKEEESIRDGSINVLQYALFITSLIFFIVPINALLVVPALTFASYWVEAFNVMQDFVAKKLARPKISIRNILITLFSFALLTSTMLIPIIFVNNLYQSEDFKNERTDLESKQMTIDDFLIHSDLTEPGKRTVPLFSIVLIGSSLILIAADFASPAVVSLFAIITEPLAQIKRRRMIAKARTKISAHKGFKVVAITGSFGKTTAKEILFEIIRKNFKTAKTRENYNSPVGIAQEVLINLQKDTEVFIAEMGAYKQGEIEASTKILPPDISVVTGIGPQHVSLFGSIESIVKAKFEIIKNLKSDGLAVFNANNEYCVQMSAKTEQQKIMCYVIEESDENAQEAVKETKEVPKRKAVNSSAKTLMLYANNIKEAEKGLSFNLKYQNRTYPAHVHITGGHNMSNILTAAAAAIGLGMDISAIAARLNFIELSNLHLGWKSGINDTQVLDDSYNSNLEGFQAALTELAKRSKIKLYSQTNEETSEHTNEQPEARYERSKTILITKGIIELGNYKTEAYQKLAKRIVKEIDLVITSDQKLIEAILPIKQEMKSLIQIEYARSADNFYNKTISNIKENDIILLEGRLPPVFIDQIIKQSKN